MLHFAVPFSAGIGALYIYRKDRKTVIQRTDGKQFALFVPVHNVLSALPESDFLSISKGTVVCRRYIVNISNDGIYTMSDGRTFQGRKGFLGVLHFMLFDCPVNSITRLTAMQRSQPLFQHIVQLIQIKRFGDMLVHAGVLC